MKKMSAMYCGHANENPCVCVCPENCYCKDHSCKDKMPPLSDEFNKYQAGQAKSSCPGGCSNCTCEDDEDFTACTELEQPQSLEDALSEVISSYPNNSVCTMLEILLKSGLGNIKYIKYSHHKIEVSHDDL